MPSTNQSGTETDYQTEADRQVDMWSDECLLNLIPQTQEVAVNYWNACNRQENVSTEVRNHFLSCMQQYR